MRIRHVTILVIFLILGVVILMGFGDRTASAKSPGDENISHLTITVSKRGYKTSQIQINDDQLICENSICYASFMTQDKAIQLALDCGGQLVFLCVVDTHFIDKTSAPIVVDVEGEISKRGEFLLLMAKERAQKGGLEAATILREGEVRDELTKVIEEEDITLVVLGKPAGESSFFELSALESFAAELEEETGVKTIIV